jgi:tripartite-type tricarboxylate transporter receptor subunit TctC
MAGTMSRFFLALCAALLASPALAQQTYPQKPIRYVVPFPAGGIADVFARIIGNHLSQAGCPRGSSGCDRRSAAWSGV